MPDVTAVRALGGYRVHLEFADGAAGDLAVVFDDRRKFAAIGLWDPTSPIRVKVLHVGAPETIDAAWWRSRLQDALGRRSALAVDPDGFDDTTSSVHGQDGASPIDDSWFSAQDGEEGEEGDRDNGDCEDALHLPFLLDPAPEDKAVGEGRTGCVPVRVPKRKRAVGFPTARRIGIGEVA